MIIRNQATNVANTENFADGIIPQLQKQQDRIEKADHQKTKIEKNPRHFSAHTEPQTEELKGDNMEIKTYKELEELINSGYISGYIETEPDGQRTKIKLKMNQRLYQIVPPLTDEEYKSLKDNIEKCNGIEVPVEIDEAGNIIDGHHRVKACLELGITEIPAVVKKNLTEEEKDELALNLNTLRRQLAGEKLKEVIRDFKEKHPNVSNRKIADAVHVSPTTVGSAVNEFATVQCGQLQKTEGSDGKTRPSSEAQAEHQRQDIRDMIKKHPEMNNHQIAKAGGASDHTVKKVREEVESESKINDDLSTSVQKENEEEPYSAPYSLKSSTVLSRIISEEADCTTEWLHSLIYECSGDPGKETMLASREGVEEVSKALIAFKETIDKAVDEAVVHLKQHEQGDDPKHQE